MAAAPTPSPSGGTSPDGVRWGLATILVVAFVLRAWNLDWDRGTHLQPDERFWSDVAANVHAPSGWDWGNAVQPWDWSWGTIAQPWQWDEVEVLDAERSTLNPRFHKDNYVYGTLPLWASEAAAGVLMTDAMEPVVGALDAVGIDLAHNEPAESPVGERLRFNTGYDVTIVGRLLSALIDTVTVGAVYLLARELTDDRRSGLMAAALQAFTVLHIQYSHFLGSEPWVAMFVAFSVWGSVRLARGRGGWRTRLATAVAVGLAVASKLSGVAVVAAPIAAALVALGPHLRHQRASFRAAARTIEPYLVMGLAAIVAYRVAQPYDFEAGASLIFNDRFERDIVYLSDINQGGNWPWVQPLVGRTPLIHPLKQMLLWGMGPGLGIAAMFGVGRAVSRVRRGERYWVIPLAVIGAYLVMVSLQFYAIIRYLQPAYPILVALAGAALVAIWRRAAALAPDRVRLAMVARTAVVVCVGATVFWGLAFVNGVYDETNARLEAGDWMVDNLPEGAAVSHQVWDDALPWGRPSTFEQVDLEPFSFSGDSPKHIELLIEGLDRVDYVIETSNKFYDALPRTPARFPQMTRYYETLFDGSLGFELIQTFQNQPRLFGITIDDSDAEEAFTVYDHPTVFIWQKTGGYSTELAYALLNPDRARTAVNAIPIDAYANGSMLRPDQYRLQQDGSSFADVHSNEPNSLVAAVLWLLAIQLISFAVAPVLLRSSGRAGGAVYGLSKPLAMAVLAVPIWLMVSTGRVEMSRQLVWATAVVLVGTGAGLAYRWRGELRAIWDTHRRTILAAEAVFIGVFLVVVALRAGNPDVWHPWRGGEKPMELAYLTAVTGSTTMPPYDPWLAGGSLNYYYMGWFVLAVPIRLLAFTPDVGFNLGVATYAALAAVTVFSTTAMLIELARRRGNSLPAPRHGGYLAVVLFLVIGNLDGYRQLRHRRGDPNARFSDFDWWGPSRVNKETFGVTCSVEGSPPCGHEVTEFPSFTVLFSDLHPHFMAMAFFGLGLAGCIALIERCRQGRTATTWLLAAGVGAGSGFMRMVHTWDFPAYTMVVAGSIVFGWMIARGPVWWRVRSAVGQLVAAGLAQMVITAPYRANNQVQDTGFHRSESVTNLDDWVAHWGLFLFVAVFFLGHRLWNRRELLLAMTDRWLPGLVALAVVIFVWLHLNVGSVAAWAGAGMTASLLLVGLNLAADRPSTPELVVAACWLLGFTVLVAVEAYTQNADIGRLNTVFKFWLQVWHLFAVAAAYAIVSLLGPWIRNRGVFSDDAPVIGQTLTRLFAVGLALLMIASLTYPVLAVGPRQSTRFDTSLGPSLEGDLWLTPGRMVGIRDTEGVDHEIDIGQDRAIIKWLQDNVQGRPTIVEAVGGSEYQWWGRISIHTGLPTVVGWRWHQSQQRTLFAGKVDERTRDVRDFYRSHSQREIDGFLRAYDVSFVIVGSAEVAIADPLTLQLFEDNVRLVTVFTDEERVIYQVDKSALAAANGPLVVPASG